MNFFKKAIEIPSCLDYDITRELVVCIQCGDMNMKKKIAVFANGWGYEYVRTVMKGIEKAAKEEGVDVFVYINYSTYGDDLGENSGELNIFKLPNLKQFDGVLIMANSFNDARELKYLRDKILKLSIPAISLEYELEDIDYLGTDNFTGMYELTEHLLAEHGCKNIVYIGGPREHSENQIRMRAVLAAADQYKIKISSSNIIYSDWSDSGARLRIAEWYQKYKTIPDAIICANDTTAMGACNWVEDQGFRVPKDVIITGYDAIEAGQLFYPVLTTVNRYWDDMGYKSIKLILEKISGKEIAKRSIVKSRLECGESCGCKLSEDKEKIRYMAGRSSYCNKMKSMLSDKHLRFLHEVLQKVNTEDGFYKELNKLLKTEPDIEGNNFMMCLEPVFFLSDEEGELTTRKYSERMDIAYALTDGKAMRRKDVNINEVLIKHSDATEKVQIYTFVALHSDKQYMGYAIFDWDASIVDNYMLP